MSGAGPAVYPGEVPSWTVLKFPPHQAPDAVPPPHDEWSLRSPFPIPHDIYNSVLSYKVPLTIATVYATSVLLLNKYNRNHGNKPWAISKTRPFKAFVILHNVFLAVYSAVTCYAMFRALKASFPHYTERNAFVGTVDALCKMNGPRGLGNAVFYSNDEERWMSKNPLVHLDAQGRPDQTDVGRIWNEGLAFWGWWFYLSKFYEVLDTAIIIAKGKRSSTLQTYHHAGAMLCMWAGMAYMSSPIWIFALVNSGIHAMMYTYYTVTAFGIRVPQAIKRTLTTLQILQFLLGASFAALHLFVSYTVPVQVRYEITEAVASSTVPVVASLSTPTAVATATGAAVAFLKQLVYRAAGDEGLAENIPLAGHVPHAHHRISDHLPHHHAQEPKVSTRVVYRTEYQHVPCIDTSGQAFAVYLNVIYLAPLTILFMRFFFKSYMKRTSSNTKHATARDVISKSTRDAIRGVDREIESLGKSAEDVFSTGSSHNARGRASELTGSKRTTSLSPENQQFVERVNRRVSQKLEELGEGVEASKEKAKEIAREIVDLAGDRVRETVKSAQQEASTEYDRAKENYTNVVRKASQERNKAKKTFEEKTNEASTEANTEEKSYAAAAKEAVTDGDNAEDTDETLAEESNTEGDWAKNMKGHATGMVDGAAPDELNKKLNNLDDTPNGKPNGKS